MIDPITKEILEKLTFPKIDVSPPKVFSTKPILKNLNDLEKRFGISLTKSFGPDAWYTRKGYKTIAVGIVVALIVAISYKVYKKFLSKAARSCKQLEGEKKNECMKKFRDYAKKARITALEKSKGLCNKSKNPQNCINKINNKVLNLRGN
jgi:hypothetical protein